MRDLAKVEIIRANGTREQHEVSKLLLLDACERLLDADVLDTVNLRDGRVMLVDDNGHALGLPENKEATKLYRAVCRPGTEWFIVGDVAVALDADFAREEP